MAQISKVNGFSFTTFFHKAGEKLNGVIDGLTESMRLTKEDFYGGDDDYDEESEFYDQELVEVLSSDPPSKAYVAHNEYCDKTIIKLYDDSGKCYYGFDVVGNQEKEYKTLIYEYTTDDDLGKEDIISLSVVKGGKKPSRSRRDITKSIRTMSPDTKEQLGRALVGMQNDAKRERVYVKPIFPEGQENKGFQIDYSLFEYTLLEMGSEFDVEPVLENLNLSLGKDGFNDETIETVLVGDKGRSIGLVTKDGLRAFLNFQTGVRQITDANSEDGLELVLYDSNGPLLRR